MKGSVSCVLLRQLFAVLLVMSTVACGMHFDYIEIGTSDFDTLLQSSGDNETGLSVDAVQLYLNRLPNRTNHFKANMGVALRPSVQLVYYLKPDDIKSHNLPDWLRGCNSVGGISGK